MHIETMARSGSKVGFALLLGLGALLATSCRDKPKPAPVSVDAGPARTPPKPKTLPYERTFVVSNPGAEPRTLLRYQFVDQTLQTAGDIALSSKSYTLKTNWTKPVSIGMTEPFTWVSASGTDGSLVIGTPGELVTKGKEPEAQALLVPQEAAWKAALAAKPFTAAVDTRGYMSKISFDHDKLASSPATQFAITEISQRWLGYTVPLPDVAVGLGARWQVVTTLRAGPVLLTQTAAYTLVAMNETGWTFDVSIARNADGQRLASADLAPDVIGELVASFRKFNGTLVVSKHWPWPQSGQAKVEIGTQQRILPPGGESDWIEFMSRDVGTWSTTTNVVEDKQRGGPPGPPLAAPPGTAANEKHSNTAPAKSPQ